MPEPVERTEDGGAVDTRQSSAPIEPDPKLLESRELARTALAEITDAATVGSDEGHEAHEAHVLTLFFECRLPGYPGWRWAATLARADEEAEPTVLEVELLPGAGAVVAPEWVPWSERLAQYREAQAKQAADEAAAAEAAADELADEDDIDPDDDLLDNDFSDYEHEIHGVELDEDDESEDDDDSPDEVDEDGFSDLDEHDLHDHDDDDLLADDEE